MIPVSVPPVVQEEEVTTKVPFDVSAAISSYEREVSLFGVSDPYKLVQLRHPELPTAYLEPPYLNVAAFASASLPPTWVLHSTLGSHQRSEASRLANEKVRAMQLEIDELRHALSEKYAVRSLVLFCVTLSFAFAMCIISWYDFGVVVVHPALAIVGLVASLAFIMLGLWRRHATST